MPTWDDAQYLKFADERTRAARELLARVPLDAPMRVVDLGCGPGNSTELLIQRWPQAQTIGVDSSASMLDRARRDLPTIEWVEADVERWQSQAPVDVLFGNAVMQWLPDHATLFPRLFDQVAPGGTLAIQMPRNFDEPSHRLMRETWGSRPLLATLRAVSPVETPGFYYDVLAMQASRVDIWQTIYEQVMPDAAAIVEWVKGTGLRPFLEALPDEASRADYLARYTHAIDVAYPVRADGQRLFTFPRLFIVAQRRA